MNILVVAESEKQKNGLQKTLSGKYKLVTGAAEAAEELKKNSYDFVAAPPELLSLRAVAEGHTEDEIKKRRVERIAELFLLRSGGLEEQLNAARNELHSAVLDAARAEELLCEIYSEAAERVFLENEWLELYVPGGTVTGSSLYLGERLMSLYRDYATLFPPIANDKTEEVILYILNNPESDLRQKTIASKMYVNSSYLSTVFAAQTGERFVDYLTSVKLKRAAYLLMNSSLNVSEIASRLDYKDIGYFSRLFKAHYGIPPSQYRLPDSYTYEI